ncbi:hypothetical protein GGX14DRAFT_383918 [Mycena pura]|uniref:Uncharacterized protein n=1 Tax=Mycena pura TaxID=153505 RepID=A0AAD6YUU7_9AGAR|nr:hypothetical protein GGX14DRAFT_383918 [Mycena pura]
MGLDLGKGVELGMGLESGIGLESGMGLELGWTGVGDGTGVGLDWSRGWDLSRVGLESGIGQHRTPVQGLDWSPILVYTGQDWSKAYHISSFRSAASRCLAKLWKRRASNMRSSPLISFMARVTVDTDVRELGVGGMSRNGALPSPQSTSCVRRGSDEDSSVLALARPDSLRRPVGDANRSPARPREAVRGIPRPRGTRNSLVTVEARERGEGGAERREDGADDGESARGAGLGRDRDVRPADIVQGFWKTRGTSKQSGGSSEAAARQRAVQNM